MPQTSPDNLPYSGLGDPPDGPAQLAALAAAVQTALGLRVSVTDGDERYAQLVGFSNQSGTVSSSGTESALTNGLSHTLINGHRYLCVFSCDIDNDDSGSIVAAEVRMKIDGAEIADAFVRCLGDGVENRVTATSFAIYTAGSTGLVPIGMTVDKTTVGGGVARMSGGLWVVIDLGT